MLLHFSPVCATYYDPHISTSPLARRIVVLASFAIVRSQVILLHEWEEGNLIYLLRGAVIL